MIDTNKNLVSKDMNEESDDDPVVAEFDVCLNGALKDQLMLLQYPLRPRYRQYGDQGELSQAFLAINSKTVTDQSLTKIVEEPSSLKLLFNLDAGVNFDRNAVDHRINTQTLLGTPVDTCGQAVDSTFATVNLNVQANYAVGVFREDKFVLTPLQKFQQVRPSFEHVDKERDAR